MKTRKQTEERAMELWPPINPKNEHLVLVNATRARQRQAFLQCFDEMKAAERKERMKDVPDKYKNMPVEFVGNKHKDLSKTCGYCVKEKTKEK